MIIIKVAYSQLTELMKQYPEARIVTDIGASMLSGWGDLREVKYHQEQNAIELIFD